MNLRILFYDIIGFILSNYVEILSNVRKISKTMSRRLSIANILYSSAPSSILSKDISSHDSQTGKKRNESQNENMSEFFNPVYAADKYER